MVRVVNLLNAAAANLWAEERQEATRMDETIFRGVYDKTASALRSYISLIAGNAALVDDILQDAFYQLWRANIGHLNEHQMKAYVYKAATSLVKDHWRKVKREQTWQMLAAVPNDTVPGTQLSHEVRQMFATLKPQEQSLLWLAYVEGFTHREIAGLLRMREKSVRVLLFRSRKRLAEIVNQQGKPKL